VHVKLLLPLILSVCSANLSYAMKPATLTHDRQQQDWQLRYWQPAVLLAGDGDPQQAIKNLNELVDLQRVITRHSEYDQQTQKFVDDLWQSFESFKLKKFYQILPKELAANKVDGWRELRVYGTRHGEAYRMGTDKTILGTHSNALDTLGDLQLVVKARPLPDKSSNKPIYHLDADLNVGLGKVSRMGPQKALHNIVQVLSTANSWTYSGEDYRTKAAAANPRLDAEDINVIAPLWASYPHSGELVAKFGQIENVLLKQKTGVQQAGANNLSYQEVRVVVLMEPKKFESLYPKLAHRAEKFGEILKFTFDINDEHGRLAQIKMDSQTLRAEISFAVNELGIIPVKDGLALISKVRTATKSEIDLTANMNARIEVLGMIYNIEGIGSKIHYSQGPTSAKVAINVIGVPKATVGGAALGFIPPSLIDFFLPTNIDEMIHEFFTVACNGNQGEGIIYSAQLEERAADEKADNGQQQIASTNLRVHVSSEIKSNFFVSVAMSMVNQRIIYDKATSEEVKYLTYDFLRAFRQDLEGFTQLVTRSTANKLVSNSRN